MAVCSRHFHNCTLNEYKMVSIKIVEIRDSLCQNWVDDNFY